MKSLWLLTYYDLKENSDALFQDEKLAIESQILDDLEFLKLCYDILLIPTVL